jgi:hypothetical protein
MPNKLITEQHYLKNGYKITIQKIGSISHLIINDSNIYPDEDSRSQDYWRLNGGLIIPINDDEDLESITKIFKKLCQK